MSMKDHYRQYYGRPSETSPGKPPDYKRCCYSIRMAGDSIQCRGGSGNGPDGAYCKTHARELEILANIEHKDRLYLPVNTGGLL